LNITGLSKSPKLDLRVVFLCCDYLEQHIKTDGLFRKTGSVVEKRRLLLALNNPEKLKLDNEYCHDVADTFKHWLRELTIPLFPNEIYEDCLNSLTLFNQTEQFSVLEKLLDKLYSISADHYTAFQRILQLLKILSDHSNDNQMTAENLSIIFGPTLIPAPTGQDPAMTMLTSKDKSSRLLHLFLENYDKFAIKNIKRNTTPLNSPKNLDS